MLTSTAQEAAGQIEYLKSVIAGLSEQIANMHSMINVQAQDNATSVIQTIKNELDALHDLAMKPIIITTIHRSEVEPAGFSESTASGEPVLDSYDEGEDYVPRDGLYRLHRGERVLTRDENAALMDSPVAYPVSRFGMRSGVTRNMTSNSNIIHRIANTTTTPTKVDRSTHVHFDGGLNINVPASAAPQSTENWREIVRYHIKPELERLLS